MKLIENNKIVSSDLSNSKIYSRIENKFKLVDIEKYFENKKYFFSTENVYSDYILIILSTEYEGYKRYYFSEYRNSFNDTINFLKKYTFIKNEQVEYFECYVIIDKKDFIFNENLLYKIFLMFNFSLIIGLKEKISRQNLIHQINRFSFYDIFSFKRWTNISNWQIFFDADHLSGIIKHADTSRQ